MFSNLDTPQSWLIQTGTGNSQTHYQSTPHERLQHQEMSHSHTPALTEEFMAASPSTHSSLKQERLRLMGS